MQKKEGKGDIYSLLLLLFLSPKAGCGKSRIREISPGSWIRSNLIVPLCYSLYKHYCLLASEVPQEVGIITPSLWMRKLSLRQTKQHPQCI